ncbi:MAG: hypothetical protein P0Y65_17110 [Candidatus Devosia phytovorans]|uniref:Uncharacterized protein n=1 Tax=Candidatus Devosia phytovorans TaxID=3121372 RepID=A0AAJ6AZJ9_9HYPH|nr:hypothetical protein [Devosia sp.]WEK03891.1 MAG: hypothetical protein P0Y65_17110 [Devosia sp.]
MSSQEPVVHYLFDGLREDGTYNRQIDSLMVHAQERDGRSIFSTYEVIAVPPDRKSCRLLDRREDADLDGPLAELFVKPPSLTPN